MREEEVKAWVGCVSVAVMVIFLACLLVGGCVIENANQQWHAGVVQEKYVKRTGNHDSFFVVLKTDGGHHEIFSIRDRAWWWQFGSADLYAGLSVGQRVKVKTIGYRVQFMSWFPNAVEIVSD